MVKYFTKRRNNAIIQTQGEIFEVENFVASTRRWPDRGNPRDAGGCYACQRFLIVKGHPQKVGAFSMQ
nr:MAG TPA: hypothetical protein [Caudoviricetes sp.]